MTKKQRKFIIFLQSLIDKPRKQCYFALVSKIPLHPPVGVFKAVWSAFYEKTYKFLFFSTGRSQKRQKFRFLMKIKNLLLEGTEKEKRQPNEIDYLCEYGIVVNMSIAVQGVVTVDNGLFIKLL